MGRAGLQSPHVLPGPSGPVSCRLSSVGRRRREVGVEARRASTVVCRRRFAAVVATAFGVVAELDHDVQNLADPPVPGPDTRCRFWSPEDASTGACRSTTKCARFWCPSRVSAFVLGCGWPCRRGWSRDGRPFGGCGPTDRCSEVAHDTPPPEGEERQRDDLRARCPSLVSVPTAYSKYRHGR